jgi:hypothetical protein
MQSEQAAEEPAVNTAGATPPAVWLDDRSPLRALPLNLDRRQLLLLDGIGMSIDMAVLAYRQLQAALHEHMRRNGPTTDRLTTVHAVMDAWTVIDATNRLRVLVQKLTRHGLKRGSAIHSFLRSVEPVLPLRNAVQHLDGQIEQMIGGGQPVWGSLSWANVESPDAPSFQVGLLMPGPIVPPYELPVVNPLGRHVEIPIGLVTLTSAGVTVCLRACADRR